jgi:predicted PurR-regulated permease PerM
MDVPLALALGILAGLLEFIPTVGPILASAPAILLAFLQGPTLVLYVVLLYLVVQWIGSYLVMPLIQHRTLSIPPALTIVSIALLGAVLGFIGMLLACPLAVVVVVLVKMIYVEDVLGNAAEVSPEEAS